MYSDVNGLFHKTDCISTGGLQLGFLSGFPRFPLEASVTGTFILYL